MDSTKIYAVGEVLISLLVIGGGFVILTQPTEESVKIAVGGFIGSATTFWFSRRQATQTQNAFTSLADEKWGEVLQKQEALTAAVQAQSEVLSRRSR